MDIRSGYPYWLVKNGLLADFPKLTENLLQEEVVIIGSGISGALVAHELCTAGFKCTMIDKRLLTSGSTWASTAHLNYEIDYMMVEIADLYDEMYAAGVYKANLDAVLKLRKLFNSTSLKTDTKARHSLYLASDKKGEKLVTDEFEMRRKHGLPVTYLDANQLKKEYAIDRPGALFHKFAAQTDSYRAGVGLILKYVKKGQLKVYTRTAITELKATKKQVTLKTDDGHRITARHVICAPGYESEMFLPEKVMALHSTYALVTQPLADADFWKDRCLIWETARPYFYVRATEDNRLMIGGEDEDFSDPEKRDALMPKKTEKLLASCTKLFPHLTVQADFSWCGTFGETKDGLPYIGEHPELPNVNFALGYGGNGTTYSMIAAEIIRNNLTGQPDNRRELFKFGR